jgi:hypothetical protein
MYVVNKIVVSIMEETKQIIIEDKRRIKFEKEFKLRVETKTWDINKDELSYENQLNSIENLNEKNRYTNKIISHIKSKLNSYKHQDILKNKLNQTDFVSFDETIELLKASNLKCHYCSSEVYILYEKVRESKQWSLDRINNELGHNKGNLLISCLECNLKRRRTNKDAFMFTKNMVISKLNN